MNLDTDNLLTWLEIDLGAIRHNVRSFKSLLKPSTQFLAVVKANAYGHGLVPVAQAATQAGADWLGVNSVNEAIVLRDAGLTNPVLLLGAAPISSLPELAAQTISTALTSVDYWQQALPFIKACHQSLGLHLKLETGTNRLGVETDDALSLAKAMTNEKKVNWQGCYSHFAAVEDGGHNLFTARQVERFVTSITHLERAGYQPGIRHMAATAATMLHPDYHFDMVRGGIGIYGLWPSSKTWELFARRMGDWHLPEQFLRPALVWKTRIVQIKAVAAGESIGYGRSYHVKRPMMVAILPVGYSDGFDRGLSSRGKVVVHDVVCPVVGRVAMNMTMIDISRLRMTHDELRVGTEVILIGRTDQNLPVEAMSSLIDTINYEIVARLPNHIPRIYSS